MRGLSSGEFCVRGEFSVHTHTIMMAQIEYCILSLGFSVSRSFKRGYVFHAVIQRSLNDEFQFIQEKGSLSECRKYSHDGK